MIRCNAKRTFPPCVNECRAEIRRGNMKEMNEKYLLALEKTGVNNRIRNFIFLRLRYLSRIHKTRDFQKLNTKGPRFQIRFRASIYTKLFFESDC